MKGREKENGGDDYENSGWKWWCDGDCVIVRLAVCLTFANLRNHFLYVMVELGNFAESHTFWDKFSVSFQVVIFDKTQS